jgi:Na+/proline symporter
MARGLELPIESAEQVLPHMAQAYLSPGLYVLFAGALVSAILSTVDSCLLVASSLVTQNLLATAYPALTPRQRLFSARAGVVAAGAVAYVLALSSESVFGLVEEASGFGSAGIFVLLVFGLFSHRGGRASAYAALFSGVSVWIAGYYIMEMRAPYLASLAAAFLAYAAFSRIEPASEAPSPVLEAVA